MSSFSSANVIRYNDATPEGRELSGKTGRFNSFLTGLRQRPGGIVLGMLYPHSPSELSPRPQGGFVPSPEADTHERESLLEKWDRYREAEERTKANAAQLERLKKIAGHA